MKLQIVLIAAALAAGAAVEARAQAQPPAAPVLKGKQVTESALIDALAIDAPEAASGATRGFRPAVRGDAKPAKPGAGKASLLITFATDSSQLAGDSQAALDALARALQSDTLAGFSFRVEGHSDARGDVAHNMELSQMRAQAVAAYLVKTHGILAERLTAVGKGSSEPLNTSRVDAPENRRVTIVTVR